MISYSSFFYVTVGEMLKHSSSGKNRLIHVLSALFLFTFVVLNLKTT